MADATIAPIDKGPELTDVRTLAAAHGIELRGDDGQPYHCGERMQVRSGLVGPDYALCRCGLAIGDMASPHINGGIVFVKEWYEQHGHRTWTLLSEGLPPSGEREDA